MSPLYANYLDGDGNAFYTLASIPGTRRELTAKDAKQAKEERLRKEEWRQRSGRRMPADS